MSSSTAARLVDFLTTRSDEFLRSVLYYDHTSHDLLYIRADVTEQYTAEEATAVVETLREKSERLYSTETAFVHGRLNCTVRCFDAAVEMHFPLEPGVGVAVAFDPEAATHLHTFVGECLDVIFGSYPPER